MMRRFFLIIFYNLFSLAELLLLLRVSLELLGASAGALAVQYLYSATNVLLVPLRGIFKNVSLPSGGTIDVVALTGMVLYLIVFAVVLKLFALLFRTREFM